MFLDAAIGIFSAILISALYGAAIGRVLFFAILFSLLPDLDFLFYKLFKIQRNKGYKHRELFHYPLLYLPIGGIAVYWLLGQEFIILFLLTSFLHFVHDSLAIGRGVKWLFPFSSNGYAFLYLYSRTEPRGLRQPVFVFDRAYLEYFDREHGDENWFNNIYRGWHPIAIIELSVFIISVFALIFYY